MEQQASVMIAAKVEAASAKLEEAVEYMRENLDSSERAPLLRAIGEIFAIMSDQIKSRLVIANPELHDRLFRGLPRDLPEKLLEMSRLCDLPKRKE